MNSKPTNPLVEDMSGDTLRNCIDVLDALQEVETHEATPGRNAILRCVMSALEYAAEQPATRFTFNIAEADADD